MEFVARHGRLGGMLLGMHIRGRRTSALAWLIAVALSAILIGCGGGGNDGSGLTGGGGSDGGGSSGGTLMGSASYTVVWPVKTRGIPGYALSVVVTAFLGDSSVVADQKILNREETAFSYSQLVTFSLPVGTYRILAAAKPFTDGGGDDLATSESDVSISQGQNTTATLVFESKIAQVFINNLPSEAVVGQPIQLTAHAQDAQGNAILLPAKALDWTLVTGNQTASLTPEGQLTFLEVGSITLRAREIDTGQTASKVITSVAGSGNGVVIIVN